MGKQNELNESILIVPTQANAIYMKNLDRNDSLTMLYRDYESIGPRRYAGIFQPEDRRDVFYMSKLKLNHKT